MNKTILKKYDYNYATSPYRLIWVRNSRKNVIMGSFKSAQKAEEYCRHKPLGLIYKLYDVNNMPVFRRDKKGDIHYDV